MALYGWKNETASIRNNINSGVDTVNEFMMNW